MRGKVNSVSGDNIKFIEKEYNSATVYNKGDTASIRGVLYSCLVNNTTGTLNMDRWKRVYLSDLAEVTSSEQALADMVDEVYDPSKTYNKSDTALYNEVLYICKNDGTTGKWNAGLWEQTTLVSILNSNLSKQISFKKLHSSAQDGGITNVSVSGYSQYLLVMCYGSNNDNPLDWGCSTSRGTTVQLGQQRSSRTSVAGACSAYIINVGDKNSVNISCRYHNNGATMIFGIE